MNIITEEILRIIENGENFEIECKSSIEELSSDIWETYSAFANTNGGTILLGVKEKNDEFIIYGLKNPKKLIKDFFDTINNSNKININILTNKNVQEFQINGKNIIKIYVPRADRKQKPIYINGNPITGTYKRNHEGDYKCKENEVKRMFAEQSDKTQDNSVLEDLTIDDINKLSLESYRKRFLIVRGTTHAWVNLNDNEFLYQIGAVSKADKFHLTLAGLLMFGNEREIVNILPRYFLDYRETSLENSQERWSNRIISSDGTWSGNLYDFYFKIINRLTSDLEVPFKLNNSIRKDSTPIHDAIREALTNTIVHADYLESGSILVEKANNTFRFSNPGNLRIPKERALKGGESDPRNPVLHKMFSLIGLGERAGSGLYTIQTAWKNQHWQIPELTELVQPDKTVLILKAISLIPNKIMEFIKNVLGEQYDKLSTNEILAIVIAAQYEYVNNVKLQNYTEVSAYESKKTLSFLVNKNLLITVGNGRGMKYKLAPIFFNEINSGSNEINSGSNEKLFYIAREARQKMRLNFAEMQQIIIDLCTEMPVTLNELSELLNRDSVWIRKQYLKKLLNENKIQLLYPDNINHPSQAYVKK